MAPQQKHRKGTAATVVGANGYFKTLATISKLFPVHQPQKKNKPSKLLRKMCEQIDHPFSGESCESGVVGCHLITMECGKLSTFHDADWNEQEEEEETRGLLPSSDMCVCT